MNTKNNLFRKSGDGRRSFRSDERGVSTVIGVILMIAITVVVAAIIASFAYGIGSPDVAPNAAISIEDAENGGNTFTVRHTGGDTIMKALDTDNDDYIETGDWSNMEVRINGKVVGQDVTPATHVADLVDITDEYNDGELPASTEIDFKPGEVLKFELDDAPTFTSKDVITVIHVPSGAVLAKETVP